MPYRERMRWEALFADMEAQLDAARTADLAAEVVELTRAERATVAVADRFRAAHGAQLTVRTHGGEQVSGVLRDAATQWILLDVQGRSSLVPLGAITAVRGLPRHSAGAGGVVERRLTLGHALRALARDRVVVQVVTDGGELAGRVERVGADHLDLAAGHVESRDGELWAVPFAAILVVRSS
ncbi:hypothetical protein DDP54_02580 [Cellulomonas sp. WB94]|nr:hypothetical protein DDP54_02580 [Cellulomonas sp. WB94]